MVVSIVVTNLFAASLQAATTPKAPAAAAAAATSDSADGARQASPSASSPAAAIPNAEPALSSLAQRIYGQTRPRLLQVRTLLKTQDSQSSVGSGFLVSDSGLLITNYPVISSYALQPKRHRLVFASIDGKQGALQLLAFDVVHDLALLRIADPSFAQGRGVLPFRPEAQPPERGSRVFSLGNPLDVGFAVTEGSYNGLVERSFPPVLFFGGSLSSGMSGGPAVDEQGRLVGVNVATRRDGEQVSFLVPAEAARALLERGKTASPIVEVSAHAEIARQLLAHEAELTAKFISQGWRSAGHARYTVPVPQETFMRCWGRSASPAQRGLQFERSDCEMDSRIFVSGDTLTGHLSVRHEAYDGSKIGALRFAQRHSASFRNESMGQDQRVRTAPKCTEQTVQREGGPPLRSVVCLRAYKKLPGLHDLSVLVASLDGSESGVQGRLDAQGISFDSASQLARHYLNGFGWIAPKNASR